MTKTNPFELFNNFDFAKLTEDMKLPGVDYKAILDAQQKNIESLTEANRVAVEGFQAVAKRQAEILNTTVDTLKNSAQDMTSLTDPKDFVAKQTTLAQDSFNVALTNMRELAEMVTKTNTAAIEVVSKRVDEVVADFGAKPAKKAKAA